MHSSPLYNKFKNFERDSSLAGWDAFIQNKSADTALSKKVGDFDMDSKTAGWDSFNKKRKRKAVVAFWAIKFPMIVAMLGFVLFTNTKEKNPFFENISEGKVKKEASILTDHEKENLSVMESDWEMENKKQLATKDNVVNSSTDKGEFNPNASKKDVVERRGDRGKRKERNNSVIEYKGVKLDLNEGILTIKPTEHLNPSSEVQTSQNRTGIQLDKYDLSIHTMDLSLLENDLDKTISAIDFDPYFIKPSYSPWYFTMHSGVTLTIPKIEGVVGQERKTNKEYVAIRNNAEIPALGYTLALGVEYKYLRNLSFKTGIGLANYRVGGTYNHSVDSVPLVDLDGTIYYLPADTMDSKPVNGKAGYQYTFLTVPIGFSRTLPINKNWEGMMDVSAEVSILTNASGNQVDDVFVNEFENFDKENLRKVNANLTLGLGLMRKINSDISIGFMLDHKSFLSPVNSNDKFNIRNRAFGLSFLTKINF